MTYASGFSVMFIFVSALIIGVFVAIVVKGLSQWGRNSSSPILSVPAVAVSKRVYNSHEYNSQYYITFQFESGDRTEFGVSGKEFGMIAEQDFGKLTFRGTRYISFERM